jgi:hypothetical protein
MSKVVDIGTLKAEIEDLDDLYNMTGPKILKALEELERWRKLGAQLVLTEEPLEELLDKLIKQVRASVARPE